jgi:hypothetical protein
MTNLLEQIKYLSGVCGQPLQLLVCADLIILGLKISYKAELLREVGIEVSIKFKL